MKISRVSGPEISILMYFQALNTKSDCFFACKNKFILGKIALSGGSSLYTPPLHVLERDLFKFLIRQSFLVQ